jgi:hypothetical protein
MHSACPGPTSICFPSTVGSALRRCRRLSLVMVMAMRRCRQALCARDARDNELKGRDGATRVFSSDQEAYRERPETDGLVGRIDVEADGLLRHVCIFLVTGVYRATTTKGNSLLGRVRQPDTLSSGLSGRKDLCVGQLIVVQAKKTYRTIRSSDTRFFVFIV